MKKKQVTSAYRLVLERETICVLSTGLGRIAAGRETHGDNTACTGTETGCAGSVFCDDPDR